MLIGTNPRREAAVLNARIRKRYLRGNVAIGMIGEKADLTYPLTYYLGAGPESLAQFVDHAPVKAEKPMFIIGQAALNRPDGAAVLAMVARLSPLFELAPNAQTFVTLIGATTALFAATIGLVQNDIKRIVAYSTCSQLGYMTLWRPVRRSSAPC